MANVGEIVLYSLTATDVVNLNRRRVDDDSIVDGPGEKTWSRPRTILLVVGLLLPAIVTKVSGALVTLQIFCDGSSLYWVGSIPLGTTPGTYQVRSQQ